MASNSANPLPSRRGNAERSPASRGTCRDLTAPAYRIVRSRGCLPRSRQSPDHERDARGGESRSGPKIPRLRSCRFDSGWAHQRTAVSRCGDAFVVRVALPLNRAHKCPLASSRPCMSRPVRGTGMYRWLPRHLAIPTTGQTRGRSRDGPQTCGGVSGPHGSQGHLIEAAHVLGPHRGNQSSGPVFSQRNSGSARPK